MTYTIIWSRRASKAIRNLHPATRRRILDKVSGLAQEPRPPDCESLESYPYFRIRVGDYRIVYDIRDTEICIAIVLIGHRRDIYEQLRRL